WAVEDERRHPVRLDREPQRPPWADHLLLPDKLVERGGAEPLGKRRRRLQTSRGGLVEEITHAVSMLPERREHGTRERSDARAAGRSAGARPSRAGREAHSIAWRALA